jgi:4-amino-4-deoxy-L-arabinose transferase-like glycosyltransferase
MSEGHFQGQVATGPNTETQLVALRLLDNIAVQQASTMPDVREAPVWGARPGDHRRSARRGHIPWPLIGVLLVQAALSLRLIWSNTAFQDESQYIWTGRLEWAHWLSGAPIPDFPSYLSGAPVVYPPLAALAAVDGLAGARLLSLAFMLGATCLLYAVAGRLYGHWAAIGAAALFGFLGMSQVLGAFATYDAMAVFLLALATWLVVRANGRASELLLLAAAVVIVLADAAKYASAMWNPVIFAVAGLTAANGGVGTRIWRSARLTAYVVALAGAALAIAGPQYEHGIMWTTVSRGLAANSTPETVLLMSWGWLGSLVAVSAVGVFLSWSDGRRMFTLSAILLAAAALAPLDQARISTITSLHKHVVFGAWFASAVGGYAIQRLSRFDTRRMWGAAVTVLASLLVLLPGVGQATLHFTTWPSFSKSMPSMAAAVDKDGCPCLMYAASDAQYYLHLSASQVTAPASVYLDGMSGIPAALDGISRGYYGVVEIDGNDSLEMQDYNAMLTALQHSAYYRLVSKVLWAGHPTQPTEVWERVIP